MLKKHLFLLAFIVGCCLTQHDALAQQTLNIAGKSVKINGLMFDYSIGEMTMINTINSGKIVVTQGILQPAASEITVTSPASTIAVASETAVKIYPNPTGNFLYIETLNDQAAALSYQLFDISGKVILTGQLSVQQGANKNRVQLNEYAAGTYFLMLDQTDKNNLHHHFSFKIQKEN